MWAGFAAYLGVLVAAPRLGRRVVWGAIVVLVAAFAVAPVLLSHDVYSYVDYARLGVVHGLDPYVHPPARGPGRPGLRPRHLDRNDQRLRPALHPRDLPARLAAGRRRGRRPQGGRGALGPRPRRSSSPASPPGAASTRCAPPPSSPSTRSSSSTSSAAPTTTAWRCCWRCSASPRSSAPARPSAAPPSSPRPRPRPPPPSSPPSPSSPPQTAVDGPIRRHVDAYRPVGRLLAGALVAAAVIGGAAYLGFGWDWLHAFGLAGENQGRTSHLSIPITVARLTGLDPDAVRVARPRPLRRPLRLPPALDLARRRLGPRRRLGRLRPAPRHLLAAPLVPDLAPAAGRHLPRPHPPAPDPGPDRLPTGRPHPALLSRSFGRVRRRPPARPPPPLGEGCRIPVCDAPALAPAEQP